MDQEGLNEGVVDTQLEGVKEKPEIPSKFLCPITKEIMKDPVMLADDGQTYERQAIIEWYKYTNISITPYGDDIEDRPPDLVPNKGLSRKIKKFLQQINS